MRLAAGAVEGAAHHQRAAGIALDQQDDLPIAQQRREVSGGAFLIGAPGAKDDDIGAVDRFGRIGRDSLDRGEAGALAFHIDAAARADLGEP